MSDPISDPDHDETAGASRATEEPIVREDDLRSPSDPRRSTATGRRAGSRILFGMLAGLVTSVVIGSIVGALAFGGGSRGFWASVVAGAIFGVLLGGFWGGLSGLGPPEVENDPLPPASRSERADRTGDGGTRSVG